MVFPFRSKKPRAGSPAAKALETLGSRHAITPAGEEASSPPAGSSARGPSAPLPAAAPTPPVASAAQSDVAAPFTAQDVRRAQQSAMQMRQRYGAIGAKKRCQELIAAAASPSEARFLSLVLRSIGGAG